MGVKTFVNNLRYLFKYNIKGLNNKLNESLKKEEILNILRLLNIIPQNDKINVLSMDDTVNLLVNTNKSFVRYGDGEFNIIMGKSIPFQEYNIDLSIRLKEILNNKDGVYIGIPEVFFNIKSDRYNDIVYDFIINYVNELNFIKSMLDIKKVYLNAHMSQIYQLYREYNFEEYYNEIKKIWDKKNVVIVCGKTIFKDIDYNIFDNCNKIDYIYAPSKNAFKDYDEILKKALKCSKDRLFIVMLGPTAKILVYDLAIEGFRALDMGHIAKDYDCFMKQIQRNSKNILKFYEPD